MPLLKSNLIPLQGASEDIKRAKNILYTTMTWDPNEKYHSIPPSMSMTPSLVSPPLTPAPHSRSSSTGGVREDKCATAAAGGAGMISGGEGSQDEEGMGAVPPANCVAAAAVAAAFEGGRSANGRSLATASATRCDCDERHLS